jgi:tetratricopeptide (TPR) repeat protein
MANPDKRMRKILSLLLLFLLSAPIASADDAFYETRLATGKQAFVEKRLPDAVADLRIAAFGFLERPALLSETLVWMALAEAASSRPERLRWALTRFLEVETKFRPYKQLALDAPSRAAFEKILVGTLSPDAIASIPTLADLVTRRPQTAAKVAARPTPPPVNVVPVVSAPAKAPAKATPAPATAQKSVPPPVVDPQPIVPRPAQAITPAPAVAQQTSSAREPQSIPAVQPKASAPVRSAEELAAETIEKAKTLLNQNRNDEAYKMLTELVAKEPSRTARKYLLHAATRTHNWQIAASQVPRIEPFKTGEEVTMFYAAIALYQTGKLADARPLLERSLPGINPSPYVDSYKQKILGR